MLRFVYCTFQFMTRFGLIVLDKNNKNWKLFVECWKAKIASHLFRKSPCLYLSSSMASNDTAMLRSYTACCFDCSQKRASPKRDAINCRAPHLRQMSLAALFAKRAALSSEQICSCCLRKLGHATKDLGATARARAINETFRNARTPHTDREIKRTAWEKESEMRAERKPSHLNSAKLLVCSIEILCFLTFFPVLQFNNSHSLLYVCA